MNLTLQTARPPGFRLLGLLLAGICIATEAGAAADSADSGNTGVVRFLNGDVLHGELVSIDAQKRIRWRNADIRETFEFEVGDISKMRPGQRKSSRGKTPFQCILRLANGDELAGTLLSLDKDKLVLETWYAGKLSLPRHSIQSMRFLSEGPSLFEGPAGLDGWTLSAAKEETNKPPWKYSNGILYSASAGGIARDFKLPDRSSIDVDVAWREYLQLTITIYTSSLKVYSLNRMGFVGGVGVGVVPGLDAGPPPAQEGPGFYAIQLNQNTAYLMTVKTNGQILNAPMEMIPGLEQKNRARFGVRVDKQKKTISLLVDGVLFKTWTEPGEFAGQGTGVRFVQQGQSLINLREIKVSEWDGSLIPPPTLATNSNLKNDFVLLKNQDSVSGTLQSVRDGKLVLAASFGPLDVPVQRVAQIIFAPEKLASVAPSPAGTVRAVLADRGSLTFRVEKCDEKSMTVSNPLFGRAQFDPSAFSWIEFNPDPQN